MSICKFIKSLFSGSRSTNETNKVGELASLKRTRLELIRERKKLELEIQNLSGKIQKKRERIKEINKKLNNL